MYIAINSNKMIKDKPYFIHPMDAHLVYTFRMKYSPVFLEHRQKHFDSVVKWIVCHPMSFRLIFCFIMGCEN